MPVKDKTEKEAYCDVCGKDWCQTCAICGGVFCEKHSIVIEFKREHRILRRRLCKKCLITPHTIFDLIGGYDPESWRGPGQGYDPCEGLPSFVAMQTDKMP